MNKDLEILFKKISANMESLQNSINYIKEAILDNDELIHETYFLTLDTFQIVVQCRALRDMLEDEL